MAGIDGDTGKNAWDPSTRILTATFPWALSPRRRSAAQLLS